MREAFNNQSMKGKQKPTQQQHVQLSQRQAQTHHQKTNSMSNKPNFPLQHHIMAYEEQQQIQGTMNSQPSGPLNQFQQQLNIGVSAKSGVQPLNMQSNHKKSNSLINSKMAQILLKGQPNAMVSGNVNNNVPQQMSNMGNIQNQILQYQQQQFIGQQQENPNFKNQSNPINTSANIVPGATVSHQTSFAHQNDLISYSIDYQKPQFYEDYEEQINQQSHLNLQNYQQQFMNQIPSNKQILAKVQNHHIIQDAFIHHQGPITIAPQDIINPQIKKQIASSTQKQASNQKVLQSAQKTNKKTTITQSSGGGSHQRTKSDTYYNRGSITAQNKQQIGSAQQQKRVQGTSNLILKNNFIETHDGRSVVSQGLGGNPKNPGAYILLNSADQSSNPRKTISSANHSKKPSSSGFNAHQIVNTNQPAGIGSKKSTKEKYIELKALYNDLLEKHYVQQQTFQQQQQPISGSKNFQQQPSNQNIINFYPNSQQLQQPPHQQYLGDTQTTTTPRLTISNQLSQSAINTNLQLLSQELQVKNIHQQQQMAKSIKHQTSKVDTILQESIKPQHQLQPKATIKLNIAQGVSRKVVGSGNHKRSVSDGNEQLFKFKQQAMQRYLYPQPSNQTLHQNTGPMNTQNTEETLGSSRKAPSQPTHQRTISDDYNQKQKKSQLQLQSQVVGSTSSLINQNVLGIKSGQNQSQIQNPQMVIVENVPLDFSGGDTTQKPTVDFNIKGFLLEMRNKHEKQPGHGFINIVDEQQIAATQNSPENFHKMAQKNGKQFAMIIEENSPLLTNAQRLDDIHHNRYNQQQISSLDSSRKMSLVDSQGYLQNHPPSKQTSGNDINKILQKYKQQRMNDKRANSPSLDLDKPDHLKKNMVPQNGGHHKRVKSDIPEIPRKQLNNPLVVLQKPIVAHVGKKLSSQSSNQNLMFNSDKNTPRKKYLQQQKLGIIQAGFPSQNMEASGSKKIINVSIDLIKDAAEMEDHFNDSHLGENMGGGHWIVVENSNQELNIDQLMGKKGKGGMSVAPQPMKPIIQGSNHIAFSGGAIDQRQDKYKKMKQKYDDQMIKNKYTLDNNNVITDRSFDQNSPKIHQQISPKGRISLLSEGHPQNYEVLGNRKPSTKQFVPVLPSSPKQQQLHSVKIQPQKGLKVQSSIANQKKIVQQNSQMPQEKLIPRVVGQPQKSAAPNNSVVQTQESARNSLIQTNVHLNMQNLAGERVETQDSTVSDPNLSPRTRGISKLTKHIKLSFRQTQQAPNTTVDFYRIGKVLGKGAFGKVNLALHKLTQKFVAVKSINKQYLSEDAQTKKVMQEVVILKRTRHRNIVRLYEFFETQKHILFVIELCAGGDLLNYVRRRRRLKEDVAKVVFKQIIEGLGYCHSKNILHRDIKLDNILLDGQGEVKICDFGVSKIVKKGEIMTEQCGTPAYIAPEILRDRGYEGFQVDVWSAGVVLYAMLYGTVPFKANNMSELQKLIIKAKYTLKDDVSEESRDLLKGLLEKDPLKRLTIPQILQHPWLQNIDDTPIDLFTEQEKEYIQNEFTYNDTDRYNRNETDPFTEHMLDSTQNSMLKNCTTKSVILAPFNSTLSNIEGQFTLSESMKQLMQSKGCLKFAARVRDIDRQYEMNNNADLDNGVYHKVEEEEEKNDPAKKKNDHDGSDDSLQSSFNKESICSEEDEEAQRIQKEKVKKKSKKKEKQTELEKLESLICQQEEQNDNDNPYGNNNEDDIYIKDQSQLQVKRSPRLQNMNNSEIPAKQILQSAQTLIIDDTVVSKIEQYGYPKDYIVKSLNNNELNYASTSYYLLQNKNTIAMKDGEPYNGGGAKLTNRTLF